MTATPCAWIFTSATLAVGEDFSHFTGRIGASEARTVRIDSPFDYRRQALLYLPEAMSEPSAPSHTRDVIDAAMPLLEAAGGRAFILFTSPPRPDRRRRLAQTKNGTVQGMAHRRSRC